MRFSLITVSLFASLAVAAPMLNERHHTEAQIAAKAAKAGTASPSNTTAAAVATAAVAKAAKTKTTKAARVTSTSTASASAATATEATVSTAGAGTLVASTYNAIQISDGVAGDGEARANAIFASIDQSNLAAVSADQLKIISGIHDVAEDAETDAFNPAIAAASGDAATALQNGKIKNKILKLTAEVLADKIKGDTAGAAAEQVKLTNNIATDTKNAGQASTAVSFDATT